MANLIAKCGMDCGTCPWGPYAREGMTTEEFDQFKKRAKEILGYTPIKKPCLTCQTPDDQIPKGSKLPSRNCLIRQCVDKIGVESCAYCSRFPCEQVKDTAGAWNREKLEAKHGPVTDDDYHRFIKPFEGLSRLERIRSSLDPEKVVDAAKVPPLRSKIVAFPGTLPFSQEETQGFKALHKLLATIKSASLGLKDVDTYPQQTRLKNRRKVYFRFLWIVGRHGELSDEEGAHIKIDSKTYMANRKGFGTGSLAMWEYLENLFKVLRDFGVHLEHKPSTDQKYGRKGWLVKSGYMRDKPGLWIMTMAFDDTVGGDSTLKALKKYTAKLTEKCGNRAFRYFANVDMRILREK
jgi:hypothetical protein